jgi:dolichol-phosphate mannosyltransferase
MDRQISIILPVYNEKESLNIMVRLLNSTLKIKNEILIVHDTLNDNSLVAAQILEKEFSNIRIIHNKIGPGVKNAVSAGIKIAKYDVILITAVDEIFPIIAIEKMLDEITMFNRDFISGTRYSNSGARLGGSLIGSILSRTANKIFNILSNIPLTDCTTGIKMFKKKLWNDIDLVSSPIGWAFAFELSIKAYIQNYRISEVPIKSVDRLFGGSSSFKIGPWIKEYLKWFVWGLVQTSKFKKNEK